MASFAGLGYSVFNLFAVCYLSFLVIREVKTIESHSLNTFICLAHEMKARIPALHNSSCWVCSLMPADSQKGLPMVPIPLSAMNMTWAPSWKDSSGNLNITWADTNISDSRSLIVWKRIGQWCLLKEGRIALGNSECTAYFNGTHFGSKRGPNISLLDGAPLCTSAWYSFSGTKCSIHGQEHFLFKGHKLIDHFVINCTLKYNLTNHIMCLCSANTSTATFSLLPSWTGWYTISNNSWPKIFPTLFRVYWVCGNKAYLALPPSWGGSCYLAWLEPPVVYRAHLPKGKIRNVHGAEDDIKDSRPLTWRALNDWTGTCAGFVFACGGTTWRIGEGVMRLQGFLEVMANTTADSLVDLAIEQKKLRQMVLQNRLALDILLASQGGTCALIGQECCVYVPDVYNITWERATHLIQEAKDHGGEQVASWWSNLFSWVQT
ncbi:endogenous retrovirus group 3 member 1 [Chelydra serpentina]|uniref:Endogenous retrovirus group 3 member 1 n=1 Tax=Chelydra serpentina TaxID=8475 RepID=A0A8T1RYX9_CHESE|nr:endogenous retrovirus group 3 member 1 [Chelydra serpentina]